jgi:hypothetical protein
MGDNFNPLSVMSAAFALSSFGGVAALLRGEQPLTPRSILASLTYSGLAGLTISLLWFKYFADNGNIYFLLGVSALAGVGGTTVMDFLIQSLLRTLGGGGLRTNFGQTPPDDPKKGST